MIFFFSNLVCGVNTLLAKCPQRASLPMFIITVVMYWTSHSFLHAALSLLQILFKMSVKITACLSFLSHTLDIFIDFCWQFRCYLLNCALSVFRLFVFMLVDLATLEVYLKYIRPDACIDVSTDSWLLCSGQINTVKDSLSCVLVCVFLSAQWLL